MRLRRAAAFLAALGLFFLALLPAMPAQNAGAQMSLDLEPSATTNISYSRQTVRLNGTISVEKPPKVLLTVYFTCICDVGWNCECSPSTVWFTDTREAAFTCAVGIPAKATNTTATVTVHAMSDGVGTIGDAYANATVTVVGSLPTNGTISPAPGPWGLNSPLEKAVGLTLPAIALVAVVITVSVTAAALFVRRRKRRPAAPPPQKGPRPII
jgi:hypothetical protein